MKKVFVCEKRSAAFELIGSRFFGDPNTFVDKNGYRENQNFIFVWCAGHLYTAVEPKLINPDYELKFSLQSNFDYHMPNLLSEIRYIPYDKPKFKGDTFYQEAARRIKAIQTVLARRDYDEIILAADADDEGEKIHSDPLKYNKHLLPKNIIYTRFWNTGSYKSAKAVKKAFEERKPITDPKYRNILASQNARSSGDYAVGMTITKVATDKFGMLYRCGRVFSALVGMVGNRETQIKNFVPKDYWNVKGTLNFNDVAISFNHFYDDVDLDDNGNEKKVKSTQYFIEEDMQRVLDTTKKLNYKGKVVKSRTWITSSNKPKPYSTDEFNSEFMDKYGVSLDYSNAHLEWLRDFGYTGYPRTNGNYFQTVDFKIAETGINCSQRYFSDVINDISKSDPRFKLDKLTDTNPIFNNAAAAKQNHTPLFIESDVTEKDLNLFASHPKYAQRGNMTLKHLKEAYDMIATRCLIQVMPDDEIKKEEIIVDIGGYLFETTSEDVVYLGWKQFDKGASVPSKSAKSGLSTHYKEGDEIQFDDVYSVAKKTTIPKHYTQRSLLQAMMFVNDALMDEFNTIQDPVLKKTQMAKFKSIKKQLTTRNGLGTQATRETILGNLVKDKLIEFNKKKEILLTETGWFVYNNLPTYLKSIETTALWEQKLVDIRNGVATYDDFAKMVTDSINNMVDDILKLPVQNKPFTGQGRSSKPTVKQVEYMKKIAQKLNIKLSKDDVATFDSAMNFINKYKDEAYPKDHRLLSDNQVAFLKKETIQAPANIFQLADKRKLTLEEYEMVNQFIQEKIKQFKSNPSANTDPNKRYQLSDKQLKVLHDERNKKFLDAKSVKLLSGNKDYSLDEYRHIKGVLDKIFASFSK